ncbi:UNVERIFIED_CONTAM: hypothetical protein HDU68_002974, partial [Siphonaria sp. JEL0065]
MNHTQVQPTKPDERLAFAVSLLSHSPFESAVEQLSLVPTESSLAITSSVQELVHLTSDGNEVLVASPVTPKILAAAEQVLGRSSSMSEDAIAFVLEAADQLRQHEPETTAANRLVQHALVFCDEWKQKAFDTVFVDPTNFVWRELGTCTTYTENNYNAHLYAALVEACVNVKLSRPVLLNAPVANVFPFLDPRATGNRIHSLIKSHISNPKNVGIPLPSLSGDLKSEAESFIAPSDSIFALRESDPLYTVEIALDEILNDESLYTQFIPYLDHFCLLLSPEAMLESFYTYLDAQGLVDDTLQPVFESFMDYGSGSNMSCDVDASSRFDGHQYDNLFSS